MDGVSFVAGEGTVFGLLTERRGQVHDHRLHLRSARAIVGSHPFMPTRHGPRCASGAGLHRGSPPGVGVVILVTPIQFPRIASTVSRPTKITWKHSML
ncbi:MAG: hypothetical protein OXN84_00010 [Albidovulum sp.]|nr:hypothetical protein [Albidovulum sp.]